MIETLIVLNNYFHDLAVSLVFVTAAAMFLLARYAERLALRPLRLRRTEGTPGAEFKGLSLFVVSKISAVFWGSVLYVIAGGISRVWNMSEFEWADAVRNGQTLALAAKYAMLMVLFACGIYLRVRARGKISRKSKGRTRGEA